AATHGRRRATRDTHHCDVVPHRNSTLGAVPCVRPAVQFRIGLVVAPNAARSGLLYRPAIVDLAWIAAVAPGHRRDDGYVRRLPRRRSHRTRTAQLIERAHG